MKNRPSLSENFGFIAAPETQLGLMGISVRTLQDWEQGRREPQGPAVALLRIAEQHPEVFGQLH
jgi:transcriptional regulator with XRE-family HTH domain